MVENEFQSSRVTPIVDRQTRDLKIIAEVFVVFV